MFERGINEVRLVGHLGADPYVQELDGGRKLVRVSIATSEHWRNRETGEPQQRTEWHDVTMFRQLADYASGNARKGDLVSVDAKLRSRSVPQPDGSNRRFTDIVAEKFQVLHSQSGSSAPNKTAPRNGATQSEQRAPVSNPAADNLGWDDNIPT